MRQQQQGKQEKSTGICWLQTGEGIFDRWAGHEINSAVPPKQEGSSGHPLAQPFQGTHSTFREGSQRLLQPLSANTDQSSSAPPALSSWGAEGKPFQAKGNKRISSDLVASSSTGHVPEL